MSIKRTVAISILLISVFALSFAASSDSERMTVEANILESPLNVTVVSIDVPNYLFFGNLTKGQKSNETKVIVNNTGNVDVVVTPFLSNSSEKIFNYTYFRLRKTSNGTELPFNQIGSFSFDIDEGNDEYFYMTLDLTNYPDDIPEAMIGHRAEITFIAMQK